MKFVFLQKECENFVKLIVNDGICCEVGLEITVYLLISNRKWIPSTRYK